MTAANDLPQNEPSVAPEPPASAFDLTSYGITVKDVRRNLAPAMLYAEAIRQDDQCDISDAGALIAYSGDKTGRSPKDKRIVEHADSKNDVWWGAVNIPINFDTFQINLERAKDYWGHDLNINIGRHNFEELRYEYFRDSMQFAKGDRVHPGDWLLCWKSGADGLPLLKGAIHWIYVHHCVSEGFVDDEYPDFAGQARHLSRPSPPFLLDAPTKRLIRDALTTRKFPKLLHVTDRRPWRVGPADVQVPRFLAHVKAASV